MNATSPIHDSTDDEQHDAGPPDGPHPFAGASVPTARDAIAFARDDARLTEVDRGGDGSDDRVWFEGAPRVVRAFADATRATATVTAADGTGREQVGIERGTPSRPEADPERAAQVRAALQGQ